MSERRIELDDKGVSDGVYEAVVAWLRGLPPCATVSWGDDGAQPRPEVVAQWLDITAEGAAPFMWIWSVTPPCESEGEWETDPLKLVVSPDVLTS